MSDFTRFCPDFVPIFYDKPRKSLTYRVLGGMWGSYKPKAQIVRAKRDKNLNEEPNIQQYRLATFLLFLGLLNKS